MEIMSKIIISFVSTLFSKNSFAILFPSSSSVKTFEFPDMTYMGIQPQRIMNVSFSTFIFQVKTFFKVRFKLTGC